MPGSYAYRRLPLFFWVLIVLQAFLLERDVRQGDWVSVAFFGTLVLLMTVSMRTRVVADDAGVLVVGLGRARRFSWDEIETISRVYGAPHYRRSEGLMAGFRTMGGGASYLYVRDGRCIRLLAIHKHMGKRVEDPVARLSAMLQDYRRRGEVSAPD